MLMVLWYGILIFSAAMLISGISLLISLRNGYLSQEEIDKLDYAVAQVNQKLSLKSGVPPITRTAFIVVFTIIGSIPIVNVIVFAIDFIYIMKNK